MPRSVLLSMRTMLDILAQIFRTLWAHKLRSFLTMFGIAWGVGSLLLLVGLGEGFRSGNQRELDQLGKDIMFIFPAKAPAVEGSLTSGRKYEITYADYRDIRREAKHVLAASPVLNRGDIRAVSEFATANGQVIGIEPQFAEIRYLPIDNGRWLNAMDEQQRRNVAVLGTEMAHNLFPGRPVVGNTILLNGIRFDVVGVLKSVGKGENNSTNSRVYLPYSVMSTFFPVKDATQLDALSFINFRPTSREAHIIARDEVRRIIARNHGFSAANEDAFEDWDTVKSAEMVGKIFDAMNLFLGSVGIVTLALGGIGVVNIMLVAVTERTREIGLRKALGATNRSILMQFFLEGILLCVGSGLIGMAAAGGLMAALATLPSPEGFDTPRLVPSTAILAISCLSLAGIVAGLYPARKAAMLTPVDALRAD